MQRRSMLGLFACAAMIRPAFAEEFPSRPIRLVAPFPAGSATDGISRILATDMTATLGQPVLVDNRPGADGIVAAQYVKQAPADGYTVMMGTNSSHAANVSLYRSLPYDPVADFAPITRIVAFPLVLVVPRNSPITSVADLIAQAKAEPGKLSYGSGNTSTRGATGLFCLKAGIDAVDIPYRGNPQAITDLIAERLDFMMPDSATALGQLRGGAVRALAVSMATRVDFLPDVPTLTETGIGEYEFVGWVTAFAPAQTPPAIIARLNTALVAAIGSPTARGFFEQTGSVASPGTPEQAAAFVRGEIAQWADVVRRTGMATQ